MTLECTDSACGCRAQFTSRRQLDRHRLEVMNKKQLGIRSARVFLSNTIMCTCKFLTRVAHEPELKVPPSVVPPKLTPSRAYRGLPLVASSLARSGSSFSSCLEMAPVPSSQPVACLEYLDNLHQADRSRAANAIQLALQIWHDSPKRQHNDLFMLLKQYCVLPGFQYKKLASWILPDLWKPLERRVAVAREIEEDIDVARIEYDLPLTESSEDENDGVELKDPPGESKARKESPQAVPQRGKHKVYLSPLTEIISSLLGTPCLDKVYFYPKFPPLHKSATEKERAAVASKCIKSDTLDKIRNSKSVLIREIREADEAWSKRNHQLRSPSVEIKFLNQILFVQDIVSFPFKGEELHLLVHLFYQKAQAEATMSSEMMVRGYLLRVSKNKISVKGRQLVFQVTDEELDIDVTLISRILSPDGYIFSDSEPSTEVQAKLEEQHGFRHTEASLFKPHKHSLTSPRKLMLSLFLLVATDDLSGTRSKTYKPFQHV